MLRGLSSLLSPVLALLLMVACVALLLVVSASTAFAHSYPKTMDPAPNGRLDATPAHVGMTFDSPVASQGTSIVVLDATGNPIPTRVDAVDGNTRASVSTAGDLEAGPYTVAWTSVSADDGHAAQGFYTFVVNGGAVGILSGVARSQTTAADLTATLTVAPADDGSSLLRVDLNDTSAVERVRIRLRRPDLGEDLLDTKPSGDGGWLLTGNEVALPGAWHAQVIVRRTNIFDDAQGGFDFTVDPVSGAPTFAADRAEYFALPIFAHAQFVNSTPAANANVQSAPSSLSATWSQELASVQFTVTGPDGSNVVNGTAQINLSERHTASVPIRDAGPGQYFVVWHNVSGDDGDPNDGSFVFTVAGQPTTQTTTPSAPTTPTRPVACVENGIKTPGIADSRVDTYCKRQAIRDQYKGKISELIFNFDLSIGMGLESSLKDAMTG